MTFAAIWTGIAAFFAAQLAAIVKNVAANAAGLAARYVPWLILAVLALIFWQTATVLDKALAIAGVAVLVYLELAGFLPNIATTTPTKPVKPATPTK